MLKGHAAKVAGPHAWGVHFTCCRCPAIPKTLEDQPGARHRFLRLLRVTAPTVRRMLQVDLLHDFSGCSLLQQQGYKTGSACQTEKGK